MNIATFTLMLIAVLSAITAEGGKADVYGLITRLSPTGEAASVIIDGGERQSIADAAGNFFVGQLEVGSHILEIRNDDFVFPPIRIDVNERGVNRYRAVVNDGSGRVLLNAFTESAAAQAAAAADAEHPVLLIEPIGKHNYFVPREGFSVMSLVKNPMIIMMIVSLGMTYLMPMIADQDELKAQMKDMQRTVNGPQAAGPKQVTKKPAAEQTR